MIKNENPRIIITQRYFIQTRLYLADSCCVKNNNITINDKIPLLEFETIIITANRIEKKRPKTGNKIFYRIRIGI